MPMAAMVMFNVVSAVAFPSETLTIQLFAPTSLLPGVPERVPFEATDNQVGPLTFEKVRVSPSASEALDAMLAL